ncbi:MAG: leucine-rich repeat domain-containing protein [Clostridia bacterium]|nr:leucine-rich repeat domain-containing protein [Clostridia bacterium]
MKKAKKFLVGLLAFASVSAFSLGVAACGEDGTDSGTLPPEGQNAIEQVYDSYVEYATAQGQTPLDYEAWLATIKGATGAQGIQGEQGVGIKTVYIENGHLFVILTEGDPIDCGPLPTDESNGSSNLSYIIIEDGLGYTVTGIGLCSDREVVIPDAYKGKPVTAIGDNAFDALKSAGADLITSIVIPDSVTEIGYNAFAWCDSLTSVTIGNSVTTIGAEAFFGCSRLTSVTIGNSVTTIGGGAFSGCSNLTSVTIGNSVTTIGEYAFSGCDSLTSATIPDSVTTIVDGAFNSCDSLTSVTIGNSVTTIGGNAFEDCDSLTSVVFIDTSTWYRTGDYEDWKNKVNGEQVDVSDAEDAADLLLSGYYWYKL